MPDYLSTFTCAVSLYDDNLSNKDSAELHQDSLYRAMLSSEKPHLFQIEIGQTFTLTIDYSGQMLTDSALTYAWLLTEEGDVIEPDEITEGPMEGVSYYRSEFIYEFEIPDSISGKLLVDIRGMGNNRPLWWSYGRSYWGIVDIVDNTHATLKEQAVRE